MSFSTIFTTAGLTLMSQAASSGAALNITEMAVGDGNGVAVTPDPTQTGLVREMYRATINRVYRPDPSGAPTTYSAELVIPASEGGFVMREVGVFLDDGTLFAVGNLPEAYKPEASEGAFADTVVRVDFIASNVDVITIVLDAATAVATHNWVTNNITAGALIPGGTTGQVLTKVSNADGDTYWADPAEASVVVNTIEEYQTLADGQTVVNLSTVTTYGLAVFIDGTRLREDATPDGWQPDGADNTMLTLGQAYTAGTEITMVQNEPTAGLPEFLRRDQNLADVLDKRQALKNLGLLDVGEIKDFAMSTPPPGWLKANGAEVSRTAYVDLFEAIGTLYGAGNGVDTFNLPDFRGEFRRGADEGRGVDPGRTVGSAQADEIRAHSHGIRTKIEGGNDTRNQEIGTGAAEYQTEPFGGAETRPRNVAVLTCIRF